MGLTADHRRGTDRTRLPGQPPPETRDHRVRLRPWRRRDEDEFLALAQASLDLHRPWISAPTTPEAYQGYLRKFRRGPAEGFLICRRDTEAIVGFVNLNEVVLGPYRRGLVGYGAFTGGTGHGYLTEGLQLMVDHLFDDLRLHRLEADIQPANQRSINLVRRLGFVREGLSPGFICINGKWMDHERWALVQH
jgi:ribosomal-protein-alanine N-acetyltransferase